MRKHVLINQMYSPRAPDKARASPVDMMYRRNFGLMMNKSAF